MPPARRYCPTSLSCSTCAPPQFGPAARLIPSDASDRTAAPNLTVPSPPRRACREPPLHGACIPMPPSRLGVGGLALCPPAPGRTWPGGGGARRQRPPPLRRLRGRPCGRPRRASARRRGGRAPPRCAPAGAPARDRCATGRRRRPRPWCGGEPPRRRQRAALPPPCAARCRPQGGRPPCIVAPAVTAGGVDADSSGRARSAP